MQMVELKEVKEFDELRPILWGICQFPTIEGRKLYQDYGLFFQPNFYEYMSFSRLSRLGFGSGCCVHC